MRRAGIILLLAASLPAGFTGCAELLGAAGSGAVVTAEYVLSGSVAKTLCFDFGRTKKALLVALRKMEIVAEKAIEVDGGEEILARADQMDIKVELKEITPCVTRVSVRAGEGFLRWDKATAQEILAQTDKIAEDLTG